MASAEDVLQLRSLINEPGQDPYTDEILVIRIEQGPTVNSVAREIWREKAARYAELVDVSEGSSSRKLSQLYKQALEMSESITKMITEEQGPVLPTRRVSRTRRIERQ